MNNLRNLAFLACLALTTLAFTAARAADIGSLYDVKSYGAKGDGTTLDTTAIQKAVDACTAAGGGTVWFPAGKFLVGTIHLKDNVTLHLTAGALILGSSNASDYTEQPKLYRPGIIKIGPKGNGNDYPQRHLVYARDAKNIAIEGSGIIDGNGDSYFSAGMKDVKVRPNPMFEFLNSTGIRIEGITIRNAPCWTIHPKNCDDVKIRGVSIINSLTATNSDGIDVDSSRKVIISDCRIESGDDCIVLKTTQMGDVTPPTEYVVVTNCVMISSASALKLGTESHGDFRHIYMSNCTISDSRTGIAFFVKDGGTMQDVHFSNITITTKRKWDGGYEWPIFMDLDKRTKDSRLGAIRDVSFSDINIYTRGRCLLTGRTDSRLENIVFRNVLFNMTDDEDITNATKIRGGVGGVSNDVDYSTKPCAFIIANAKNLVIDGLNVRWSDGKIAQARGIIFGDQLDEASLTGIRGKTSDGKLDTIEITNSKNVQR